MSIKGENRISSNVLGVAYTDMVCYIIPGMILLILIFLIYRTEIIDYSSLLSKIDFGSGILLIIVFVIISYISGFLISMIRWQTVAVLQDFLQNESIGLLILRKKGYIIRNRVSMPDKILKEVHDKIISDFKTINIDIDNNNHRHNREEKYLDCFVMMILDAARESNKKIFAHFNRWDDVHTARKNILVACAIAVIIWLFSNISLYSILLSGILIIGILIIYLFILPLQRYSHYRWLLTSYLRGEITVVKKST